MEHFEAHAAQANRNIRLFNDLDHQWADWKIISAYYGALHLVHTSIALSIGDLNYGQFIFNEENSKKQPRQLTLHKGIAKIILNPKDSQYPLIHQLMTPFDVAVVQDFTELLKLSMKARYLTNFFSDPSHPTDYINSWISPQELALAHKYLQNIIRYLPSRHTNNQPPFPAIESLTPLNVP